MAAPSTSGFYPARLASDRLRSERRQINNIRNLAIYRFLMPIPVIG
jgi:hypothetical protein